MSILIMNVFGEISNFFQAKFKAWWNMKRNYVHRQIPSYMPTTHHLYYFVCRRLQSNLSFSHQILNRFPILPTQYHWQVFHDWNRDARQIAQFYLLFRQWLMIWCRLLRQCCASTNNKHIPLSLMPIFGRWLMRDSRIH